MSISDNKKYIASLRTIALQQSEQVLVDIKPLSDKKLESPRHDGGWSVAQCLEHLNTYSRHYLPLIEQHLQVINNKTPKPFKSGWLGRYFINMMDAGKSNARYKAAKTHQPSGLVAALSAIDEFLVHQQKLITLLNAAEKADLNNIRIKTSIAGFISLKLGDVLRFLLVHNKRHLQQAVQVIQTQTN